MWGDFMKGNISKKKGLLSEMTNDHLDYISDKLYGKVGFTREDFEKLKEETAQEYNDLAEVVVSKEDVANKSTTIDDNADDVKYPTTKAVKVYADKSKERAVKEASELIMKEVSDNYYNKTVVDNKISSIFKYCGTVEFARELPQYNVNENIGYVYNILKSNDELDESIILVYPSVNVEWYGKVSLISDSYYLTIKDKDGNDITQSLPEGQGMTLIHNAPYPTWDGFPYTSINFNLTDNTTNGWRVSIDDTLLDIIEDKDNIYFSQYMYDILEPKAGDNVVWNGYMWDILSGTIDLSDYATKEDVAKAILDSWGVGV